MMSWTLLSRAIACDGVRCWISRGRLSMPTTRTVTFGDTIVGARDRTRATYSRNSLIMRAESSAARFSDTVVIVWPAFGTMSWTTDVDRWNARRYRRSCRNSRRWRRSHA